MEQSYFPNAVRTARLDKGLSQADLARAAGVTKQYISLIEGGNRQPPQQHVLTALSNVLEFDVDLDSLARDLAAWHMAGGKPTSTD